MYVIIADESMSCLVIVCVIVHFNAVYSQAYLRVYLLRRLVPDIASC